ncbi:hypothetical protein J31TS4_03770 [Paenibacillus sp. J31TS4]|uniref:GNAT family N-acetyltransferase n=1 Tax=Paenibacillus sp. J31TS4 TaxID=2807195 RepID=UPI001B2C0B89|nr:GNAT family N-acetyltransferase [Paenibacillus sp. J31TS4]GIP37097.1 hypothetical protein J31TS4_03770 [Paenibacillus sp. J31TS4]
MLIRKATTRDLEFLIQIDRKNEGLTLTQETMLMNEDLDQHRRKIARFVTEDNRGAFIYETNGERRGAILFSESNRDTIYPPDWKTIFHELDRGLFQKDGRFLEVFNLWVDPCCRRTGIATRLKLELEQEALRRQVNVVYTHTEERNEHVLELNRKLGYVEVRRGPIWDDVIRVSLIKQL